LPHGAAAGVKGGWLTVLDTYPSEMAQNFWTAIYAFTACFVLTIAISLVTRPRDEKSLVGLVYALTAREVEQEAAWYTRPAPLGIAVLAAMILLNLWFW
jgi:SSS family solute:Na+ symporter